MCRLYQREGGRKRRKGTQSGHSLFFTFKNCKLTCEVFYRSHSFQLSFYLFANLRKDSITFNIWAAMLFVLTAQCFELSWTDESIVSTLQVYPRRPFGMRCRLIVCSSHDIQSLLISLVNIEFSRILTSNILLALCVLRSIYR